MSKPIQIPDEVIDYFTYDALTGELRWTQNATYPKMASRLAGSVHRGGSALTVKFKGHTYGVHRVAWFIQTGQQPPEIIDHRDGDGTNNRWSNLRAANKQQNGANRRATRGRTLPKGVMFDTRSNKYVAQVTYQKRCIYLGAFDDPQSAAETYLTAARKLFGDFARAA